MKSVNMKFWVTVKKKKKELNERGKKRLITKLECHIYIYIYIDEKFDIFETKIV